MIKNTVIAILTAATLLGAAAPAFADTNASGDSYDILDDNSDAILASLQAQGINASSVEDWGTLVRAYVTQADGSQVMQYFDANTLGPVTE